MSASIRGVLIAESLHPGFVLKDFGLALQSISRITQDAATEVQPEVWTLIAFEGPERVSSDLATCIAGALFERGWYADFHSAEEVTVIFPGRIFRYRSGDSEARLEAEQYGRQLGIPSAQLDWPES